MLKSKITKTSPYTCKNHGLLESKDFFVYEYKRLGKVYVGRSCKICSKKNTQSLRIKILQHYSGLDIPQCECCSENLIQFLALDHIEGDGNKHRKEIGVWANKTTNIYRWVVKNNFPPLFRVLCHNCNMSIGLYGYCPHSSNKK